MSTEFKREERYIVFKISDIRAALSTSEFDDLRYMHRVVNACRERNGKDPLTCVVVEKDWPEYEPTWKAIEARVTGTQVPKVPKEAIAKILTEVMDIAVSNGADSRSMPDTRRQTRVDSERADATLWPWKGLQRIGRRYRHSATPLQAGAYSEHTAQHKPSA